MEFKGTKGKLKVVFVEKGIGKGIYLSGENQKYFIANVIEHDRTNEENLANAILFSKSPEMLEMLKDLVSKLDSYSQVFCHDELSSKAKQLIKESTEINPINN